MKTHMIINGKNYRPAALTFNNVCNMEEMGANLNEAQSKSMSLLRAYLAVSMNVTAEVAGNEMEAHVINGGDFTELGECLEEALKDSGFFQALNKRTETTSTASEAEAEA